MHLNSISLNLWLLIAQGSYPSLPIIQGNVQRKVSKVSQEDNTSNYKPFHLQVKSHGIKQE